MQNRIYEIIPYKSIGNINFLDKRDSIRKKIGGGYTNGRIEFNDIVELYDFFPEQDIKVLYDKNECLSAIEFFKDGGYFLGENIINMSYLEIKSIIMSLDPDLDHNQDGFTSYKLGIGIGWDEEDDAITSVIVFKKGYYN